MKTYCKFPFENVIIEAGGYVYFCCSAYNNHYCLGNFFENSFEEIWYGDKAIEFRKSILDKSYKYCNLKKCSQFCEFDKENLSKKEMETLLKPPYPKKVYLSHTDSCNVRCMMCRDNITCETKQETEYLNNFTDKIIDICKNAEIIYMNGCGEFLTSPHSKNLIKKLTDKYPHLKFELSTNGLLFNKKNIKEIGLEGKIKEISISIHSATKETYEKIVRGGKWEQLLQNLEYIKSLNNTEINFNFVIHSLNYKEMPAFVKMANKYNATALFWRMDNWSNSQMSQDFNIYTCWKPWHSDYKNFLKTLNKLKRMKNYHLLEPFLRELQAQTKDPWYIKLLHLFKKD
ncbi:MAG: radical SAM protein [Alphaproteobacteria bacterium]